MKKFNNHRLFTFLILLLSVFGKVNAQCPASSDNFTFTTQQQIDSFGTTYAHCTDITLGNVTIAGSDITNLDGLSKIKHITGSLWISANAQLFNLDGLENLQTVHYLYIEQNHVLEDISGLSGLQSIGTSFILYLNPQLTTVSGLDNLTTVGTDFHIDSNAALVNLNGLTNLAEIGGQLYIKGNSVLNDISGLANINPETIGGAYGLYIVNNPALSVCNLPNFCTYLADGNNPRTISGNLADCLDETAVTNACAVACTTILEDITFNSQAEIDDFGATYSYCTAIMLDNVIISGDDITNLDGLNNLTTIGGDLVIFNNPQLQNLDGLNNTNTVGGGISISQNAQLTDISGLANIDPESIEDLVITDNIALSVCNLINICTYLADQTNLRTINNNAGDCITEQAATAICTAPCNMGNFFFTTQQQIDDFGTAYPYCNDITLVQLRIGNGDITNLDGLSKVKAVTEELIIWDSSQLTDINGLSSLESIGGYLWIHNASQLTNLDGFSSLQTVGDFSIQNNNALTDISGLSGLTSTRGVIIYNNPLLTNLDALSGLVTIGGSIGISENDSLTDISGLQNIDPETITYLEIRNNTDLSVCNLPNFCTYLSDETNSRIISGNAGFCLDEQAVTYHCLPCPTSEDDFTFNNQQQIDTFGEMYLHCDDIVLRNLIISGGDITNLDGLSHITGVTGNLTIQYTQLTGLNVFSNFTGIGGNLTIAGNPLLTTLDGLSNVTTVEGNLDIGYNSSLINLDALANLTSIAGGMHIFNHPVLADISGLTNIDPESIENLSIVNNTVLSVCNLPNFCTYLSDETHPRTISGNADDCISSQAVENACFTGDCESYTLWNGTEWSNGEPDTTKKAIIDEDLILDSSLEACELEVTENGSLNIPSGKTFTVNGAIVNNAGEENFIVESDGNLIQVEDVENTGAITVRRNSTPMMRLDYALWSSPVDGQGIHAFSPETVASRIYTYEGEDSYQLVPDLESSDFIAGKGYMFRAPNNWNLTTDANDGNPVAYPGEFKGIPFNGNISIAVHPGSYTSVGNPYASNIKLGDNPSNPENDTLLNANPEVGTIYFWTNTYGADGAGGYTGNNWATYTLAGGTSAGFGSGGTIPVPFVAPGQGFIISSTESGTSVSFNNTMRTSEEAIFFKNEEEPARFWLNLDGANNESYNQVLIGYMNGATLGIDNQIDGKMFCYEGSAIYNLIDDASTGSATRFTIQGRPLPFEVSDVVPLGFRAIEDGKFKISLSNYEGIFAEGQITIFIKDKALHQIHNLMDSAYEFESLQGEFDNRFEVVYEDEGTMATDDQNVNQIQIYTDNDYIVVDSKTEKILSVELYDLSGRNLFRNEKVNAHHYRGKSLSKGIIVVKAQSENGEIVTKKLINN